MEKADTIVSATLREIILTHQKNANRDYYYPKNDAAKALLKVMKRKALVPSDFEALKELGRALELNLAIKTISEEQEL